MYTNLKGYFVGMIIYILVYIEYSEGIKTVRRIWFTWNGSSSAQLIAGVMGQPAWIVSMLNMTQNYLGFVGCNGLHQIRTSLTLTSHQESYEYNPIHLDTVVRAAHPIGIGRLAGHPFHSRNVAWRVVRCNSRWV